MPWLDSEGERVHLGEKGKKKGRKYSYTLICTGHSFAEAQKKAYKLIKAYSCQMGSQHLNQR